MSEPHLELSDMRAKLRGLRLIKRRATAVLGRLDNRPEAFLTTNARQLIRDQLYTLSVHCRELETAIIIAEKANTTRRTHSEVPHA